MVFGQEIENKFTFDEMDGLIQIMLFLCVEFFLTTITVFDHPEVLQFIFYELAWFRRLSHKMTKKVMHSYKESRELHKSKTF